MSFDAAAASFDKRKLKTSYRASRDSLKPIYTGGPAAVTRDGELLVSSLGEGLLVTKVSTGRSLYRIRGDGTPITALALSYHTYPPTIITAHQSLNIRYYPLPEANETASVPENTATPLASKVPLLQYTRQLTRSQTHQSPILILSAVTTDDGVSLLASGSADGVVKVWDAAGGYATHVFKAHGGPISALKFNAYRPTPSDTKGKGKSREVADQDDGARFINLVTGCVDTKVRIFDLMDPAHRTAQGGRPKHVLDAHVSVVRGIDVTQDGNWLITAGRDKVVLIWDISGDVPSQVSKQNNESRSASSSAGLAPPRMVQTILAQEAVEAVGFIDLEDLDPHKDRLISEGGLGQYRGRTLCFTGGERGPVRIWDALQGTEVSTLAGPGSDEVDEDDEGDDDDEPRGLADVLLVDNALVSIHHDQNIVFHSLDTLNIVRQIIGFNDEVIDMAYLGPSDNKLVLATNSTLLRVYDTKTMDARLVKGHTDVVLCLGTTTDGLYLVSGSKDNTAHLWDSEMSCLAVCSGHADSIGAVAFSKQPEAHRRFLFTGSMDRTVKMWDLATGSDKPKSLATLRIHEKDINSLDVSPNDQFLASGSQDKLVKIFQVSYTQGKAGAAGAIKPLGVCKGHKRGVWSVKFSPSDRVVASAAADRTIKIWSLDDFTCLKTLEGHTNSVLRVDFLTAGMQLVSSASDGLVKLWNIRDEECIKTLDGHEDKVWALALSKDERTIVSGGADSRVVFWEDCSVEEQQELVAKREKEVAEEQDFANYLSLRDYRRAIQLALAMVQPGRLLNLFSTVHSQRPKSLAEATGVSEQADFRSVTGSAAVDQVLAELGSLDLVRLLKFVRDWNARAKTSEVAQRILLAILKFYRPDQILQHFESASKVGSKALADDADESEGNAADPFGMDTDEQSAQASADARRKAIQADRRSGLISIQDLLDGLLPYTERHYERIERTLMDSYMVDYVLGEMDGGLIDLKALDDLPGSEEAADEPLLAKSQDVDHSSLDPDSEDGSIYGEVE